MKKRNIVAFILALSIMLSLALPVSASYIINDGENSSVIDQDMATTIAMLFVASNLDLEDEWDMNIAVQKVVPLYNENDDITAYCIEMVNNNQCAGYVTVSTDMNSPLIQEYAPGIAPLFEDSSTTGGTSVMSFNTENEKVYYAGPLQYSTEKSDVEAMVAAAASTASVNNTASNNYYSSNTALVNLISNTGTLGDVTENVVGVNGTIITNPLSYLQSLYPTAVFTNTGWNSLGENAIYAYDIAETNACAMYAIAAIIQFYKAGYTFTGIKNKVLELYAEEFNNGNATSNYYLDIGDYTSFTDICIDEYSLSKTVSSTAFNYSIGKTEIDNGRPYMLNLVSANGGYYYDHTVTVYAYTGFTSANTSQYHYFYKVRDGYTTASSSIDNGRYVAHDTMGASFITKIV